MLTAIVLTFLLVFLNGFFVAAEFAIVKVRSSQVDVKVATGSKLAKATRSIISNIDPYLSACQLGITLTSLGLGWVGEQTLAHAILELGADVGLPVETAVAHTTALGLVFVVISILHIVLGELAPKTLAIRHPEQLSYAVAIPLSLFYVIFRPFIWILNSLASGLLRLIGVQPAAEHEVHSQEELRLLLEQSMETGTIESSEHELIEQVFNFGDRVVHHVMTPRTRMAMLDVDLPSDQILDVLFREGYSRLPVYKSTRDNIVGVIHSRDVFRQFRLNRTVNLRDVMRPPYFVPESKKINDLLREFQEKRIHMAVAVDEFGVASGVVTLEDIVEELVGEIQDEHDEETPVVEAVGEREFLVKAYASIIDANKALPAPLPESNDYTTVGGLLNLIFGTIPHAGAAKEFGAYAFHVVKTSMRSVELVRLTLLEKKVEEEEDLRSPEELDSE